MVMHPHLNRIEATTGRNRQHFIFIIVVSNSQSHINLCWQATIFSRQTRWLPTTQRFRPPPYVLFSLPYCKFESSYSTQFFFFLFSFFFCFFGVPMQISSLLFSNSLVAMTLRHIFNSTFTSTPLSPLLSHYHSLTFEYFVTLSLKA